MCNRIPGARSGPDADEHGGHENERAGGEKRQGSESRSGAEAAYAPSDAENRRAADERQIDLFRGRQVEIIHQYRRSPSTHELISDEGDDDGASHDEGEAWVPGAGKVEEVEDLGRIGH